MYYQIPNQMQEPIKEYFGTDEWFFIKHPRLGYVSPYAWLKEAKDESVIQQLIKEDTVNSMFLVGI
jgi:hypothetical protein